MLFFLFLKLLAHFKLEFVFKHHAYMIVKRGFFDPAFVHELCPIVTVKYHETYWLHSLLNRAFALSPSLFYRAFALSTYLLYRAFVLTPSLLYRAFTLSPLSVQPLSRNATTPPP